MREEAKIGVAPGSAATLGESIIAGLTEAIAWSEGQSVQARVTTVPVADIDVQRVRQKLGLGQNEFARKFGFTLASTRNWEQRRRRPEAAARILLSVIDRHPEIVEEVLDATE